MKDTLHESAMITANGVRELRAENLSLTSKLSECERLLGIEQAELAMTRERLAEVQRQLDFYMRYSVELTTQLNVIQMVVADAMNKAKDSTYRPTLAAPEQESIPDDEPMPAVVTLGPRQEAAL